ncbi:MAG: hypothetical protein K8S13_09510 [Desulfobacula sp.]|uniref:hypothetical protein n=1 Tax=Desulfobacula sp. TaxID=2593537 RepID=UPI0025B7EA5D|nr:hypothetical protein [Desulfobacula sp.]MCD4720080.1 hypothetical protein [Desulfobacula sp.]
MRLFLFILSFVFMFNLLSGTIVHAIPRILFVQITVADPVKYRPAGTGSNFLLNALGLIVHNLPEEENALIRISAYLDRNNDGLFDSGEKETILSFSKQRIAELKIDAGPGKNVIPIPGIDPDGIHQLQAELMNQDGNWLCSPSTLVLSELEHPRFNIVNTIAAASKNTFLRLLNIYDVVRSQNGRSGFVYRMALKNGIPDGAAKKLVLKSDKISHITLSPFGEKTAWIESNTEGYTVLAGNKDFSSEQRVFESQVNITGLVFINDDRLVCTYDNKLTFLTISSGQRNSYDLPVKKILKLYSTSLSATDVEIVLKVRTGSPNCPCIEESISVRVDSDGRMITGLLPESGLYEALPNNFNDQIIYFIEPSGNDYELKYITMFDEKVHSFVKCLQINSFAISAEGKDIAWLGVDCGGMP